jgi:hypothetical protein
VSRGDRNFALFLAVMLVAMAALFYELFPRHDDQSQVSPPTSGSGPSAPGTNPANAPQKK